MTQSELPRDELVAGIFAGLAGVAIVCLAIVLVNLIFSRT